MHNYYASYCVQPNMHQLLYFCESLNVSLSRSILSHFLSHKIIVS